MLLVLHAAFSLAPALRSYRNDFLNYYLPARACRDGLPLDRAYERLWMARQAERAGERFVGLFMPNPPPNALLLVPLAGLRAPAAKAAWTAILAASLAAAFLVLRAVAAAPAWLVALAFLLPSSALANALAYGPPYPLLVLLLALALAAGLRGREWASGLLLGPVVALKLYAVALLPWFLWTRRWRAAAGLVLGSSAIAALSIGVLGLPVHAAYVREMLPASLEGRVIDPYSPLWQTVPAVARRLFQLEPELNPQPVADVPTLASFLARFVAGAVLAASVLVGRPREEAARARREWAVLLLAALAVSPMTASYHLVLLSVPCALLVGERASRARVTAVLALLAFAASPLPHAFTRFAHGWVNLAACPRLAALLALWGLAIAPLIGRRTVALAVVAGVAAGATSLGSAPLGEPGARVAAARGPLLGEPFECAGRLRWIAPEPSRYVLAADDGTRSPADTARCIDGTVAAGSSAVASALGVRPDAGVVDVDRTAGVTVIADAARGELRERNGAALERVLARGRIARPRLSPDARWVVYQQWAAGSWDVRALERSSGRVVAVAQTPANESEPSWAGGGSAVLFLSDQRRGLFGGAIYRAPFAP